MAGNECKIIEEHLKAMLFKNRPASNSSSPKSHASDATSPPTSPIVNSVARTTISHSPHSPFREWELGGQQNLALSGPVNGREAHSELIDRTALTNFAAQHLGSPSSSSGTGSTHCDPSVPGTSEQSSKFPYFRQLHEQQSAEPGIPSNRHSGIPSPTHGSRFTDIHCDGSLKQLEPLQSNTGKKEARIAANFTIGRSDTPKKDNKENAEKRRAYNKAKAKERRKKRIEEGRKSDQKPPAAGHTSGKTPSAQNSTPAEKLTATPSDSKPLETIILPMPKDDAEPLPQLEYVAFFNRRKQWIFVCDVCDYNTSAEGRLLNHLKSAPHQKLMRKKESDRFLRCLPDPLIEQVATINQLIFKKVEDYGLRNPMIRDRKNVAARINSMVSQKLPGCSIEIVGSSVSGFGLKDSEIDLVLKVPPEINAADMLASTYDLLSEDAALHSVHSEFSEKVPRVTFRQNANRTLQYNITISSGYTAQMTKLLSLYANLDQRVPILGTAFKLWAKLCELDQPDKGTLPSFCFPLMMIYFLQHLDPPVLPVIPVDDVLKLGESGEQKNKKNKWESQNKDCVGLLWIKLFKFYSFEYEFGTDVISVTSETKITCSDKNWGTKFFAIEDPFVRRNLGHVIPNRQVFEFMHNCFINTYRYFAHPQTDSGEISVVARTIGPTLSDNTLPSTNGALNSSERAVDTSHSPVNSSRSAGNNDQLAVDNSESVADNPESLESNALDNLSVKELLEDQDPDLSFEEVASAVNNLDLDESEVSSTGESVSSLEGVPSPCFREELLPPLKPPHKPKNENIIYEWNLKGVTITSATFKYEFWAKYFKGHKSLPLVCRICQRSGHLKNDCPDEVLPPVFSLPKMTKEFMVILNEVCMHVKDVNQPTKLELRHREEDRIELQEIIKEVYPGAVLKLYGSFCNGFGFTNSDMDFCLTFINNKEGKDVNQVEIIETLANKLRKHPRYTNVVPITSAKVPIVKFHDVESGLESDISLYNTLAQHNTRMLETYCRIDRRVQIIGYVLKYFAKVLDICDASRGSLSSYAYILMAIFFLQQRNPPVIPVLQELYSGEKPKRTVDGWNAWFFDDIERLHEVWPDYGKNRESVGELWIGLLSFYARDFNMKDYVISIRQKELLSRFRKLWNSNRIAIEDPFDLQHNLGSGLSRKMNNYIIKAFIRGREHFGTPVPLQKLLQGCVNGVQDYFFNRHSLNKGFEPPNDRVCRFCGKIGHYRIKCPLIAEKKAKKEEDQKATAEEGRKIIKKLQSATEQQENSIRTALNAVSQQQQQQPRHRHPVQPSQGNPGGHHNQAHGFFPHSRAATPVLHPQRLALQHHPLQPLHMAQPSPHLIRTVHHPLLFLHAAQQSRYPLPSAQHVFAGHPAASVPFNVGGIQHGSPNTSVGAQQKAVESQRQASILVQHKSPASAAHLNHQLQNSSFTPAQSQQMPQQHPPTVPPLRQQPPPPQALLSELQKIRVNTNLGTLPGPPTFLPFISNRPQNVPDQQMTDLDHSRQQHPSFPK